MASAAEAQPKRPNRQCLLQFPRCGLASADYLAPLPQAWSPPFQQDLLQIRPGDPAVMLFASHDFAFSSLRRFLVLCVSVVALRIVEQHSFRRDFAATT
jgi:hypothetical protein